MRHLTAAILLVSGLMSNAASADLSSTLMFEGFRENGTLALGIRRDRELAMVTSTLLIIPARGSVRTVTRAYSLRYLAPDIYQTRHVLLAEGEVVLRNAATHDTGTLVYQSDALGAVNEITTSDGIKVEMKQTRYCLKKDSPATATVHITRGNETSRQDVTVWDAPCERDMKIGRVYTSASNSLAIIAHIESKDGDATAREALFPPMRIAPITETARP